MSRTTRHRRLSWSSLVVRIVLVAMTWTAVGAGWTEVAAAQSRREEARRAFLAGIEAARTDRWEAAAENFRRAYELSGTASALFNMAAALRAQGNYRETAEALEQFLRDNPNHPKADDARELAEEARSFQATLVLEGVEAGDDIRVDGERWDPDEKLTVDPGQHVVVVTRPGAGTFQWEGRLTASQTTSIDVEFAPTADTWIPTGETARPEDRSGGNRTPGRALLGTAAVLGVAAIATGSYAIVLHNKIEREQCECENRRNVHGWIRPMTDGLAVGAVAAAAIGTWLLVKASNEDDEPEPTDPSVSLGCGPTGCMATFQRAFH